MYSTEDTYGTLQFINNYIIMVHTCMVYSNLPIALFWFNYNNFKTVQADDGTNIWTNHAGESVKHSIKTRRGFLQEFCSVSYIYILDLQEENPCTNLPIPTYSFKD